jgi:hypothetical protein
VAHSTFSAEDAGSNPLDLDYSNVIFFYSIKCPMYFSLFVFPSQCRSFCLPVCLSVCLPVCLSACLSTRTSAYCLPVCMSVCLSFCLSVSLSFRYMFFYQFLYISILRSTGSNRTNSCRQTSVCLPQSAIGNQKSQDRLKQLVISNLNIIDDCPIQKRAHLWQHIHS